MRAPAAVVAVTVLLGACAVRKDLDHPTAAESPDELAAEVVEQWSDGDREAVDALAEQEAAVDELFEVEPPEDGVEVVSCDPDSGLPGAESCLVRGGGLSMVLTTVERDDGWRLLSTLVVR